MCLLHFFLLSYSSTNTFPLVNPNVELINRDLTSLCRRIISRERQCVPVTVINTSLLNNYLKLTGGLNRKHAFKIKQGFWMHTETILGLGGIWNQKAHKWHPACAWLRRPHLRVVCNNLKLEWENERFIIISGDFMWSWGLIQRQKPQTKSARRDKSPSMVFIREFKSISQNNTHINITFTSN